MFHFVSRQRRRHLIPCIGIASFLCASVLPWVAQAVEVTPSITQVAKDTQQDTNNIDVLTQGER